MQTSSPEDLKSPQEYRAKRAHIFPSEGSLEWYLRQNREQLVKCLALRKLRGRWWVNQPLMDAALVGETPRA